MIIKTPSRRRSVCIARTPIPKFSEDELKECTNELNTPESNIIREELLISPRPPEPIVNIFQPKNQSGSETEYETFVNAIPMNSTVLAGSRKVEMLAEEEESANLTDDVQMTDDVNRSMEMRSNQNEKKDDMSQLRINNTTTDLMSDLEDVEQEEVRSFLLNISFIY